MLLPKKAGMGAAACAEKALIVLGVASPRVAVTVFLSGWWESAPYTDLS